MKRYSHTNSASRSKESGIFGSHSLVLSQRASRFTTNSHTPSNVTISLQKPRRLPPHVEEVLQARSRVDLTSRLGSGQGIHNTVGLLSGLDRVLKALPWETEPAESRKSIYQERLVELSKSRSQTGKNRRVTQHTFGLAPNKYLKFFEIIDNNPFKKITLTNSNDSSEGMAGWVSSRLDNLRRNVRFFLPSDLIKLEDMCPLSYLENCIQLSAGQRRRYDMVFDKYAGKAKVLDMSKLLQALESMFSFSFGRNNFEVLQTVLFLEEDAVISSAKQFAGICALAERLFWTSYLETNENTFFVLGNNRSLLECADFNGLKFKLDTLNISTELYSLLFSLA